MGIAGQPELVSLHINTTAARVNSVGHSAGVLIATVLEPRDEGYSNQHYPHYQSHFDTPGDRVRAVTARIDYRTGTPTTTRSDRGILAIDNTADFPIEAIDDHLRNGAEELDITFWGITRLLDISVILQLNSRDNIQTRKQIAIFSLLPAAIDEVFRIAEDLSPAAA